MAFRTALALVAVGLTVSVACDSARPTPAPAPSPVAVPPPPPAPEPPPVTSPDPNDRLPGKYSLTLDLGNDCRSLLGEASLRRYTATIAPRQGGGYVVTLEDAVFLGGAICGWDSMLGCHQFSASRDGDQIQLGLINNNDDAHGGHIVERTAAGTWLEIIGAARGTFDGTAIEAAGSNSVWYCSSNQGYPFPCHAYTSCGSDDMTLRFARR